MRGVSLPTMQLLSCGTQPLIEAVIELLEEDAGTSRTGSLSALREPERKWNTTLGTVRQEVS